VFTLPFFIFSLFPSLLLLFFLFIKKRIIFCNELLHQCTEHTYDPSLKTGLCSTLTKRFYHVLRLGPCTAGTQNTELIVCSSMPRACEKSQNAWSLQTRVPAAKSMPVGMTRVPAANAGSEPHSLERCAPEAMLEAASLALEVRACHLIQ
jgi:hypothetical protein